MSGQGLEIPISVRPELRGGERARPLDDNVAVVPDELEVRPMYVQKTDVRANGLTLGCQGCWDVTLERERSASRSAAMAGRG